jgi:hypothetical protein
VRNFAEHTWGLSMSAITGAVDGRQRAAPLQSRTAQSRHQAQLGVDNVQIAHRATFNDSVLSASQQSMAGG